MPVDHDYLTRRLADERQRAAEADTDAARLAHQQLAEHYAAEIERLRSSDDDGFGLQGMTA